MVCGLFNCGFCSFVLYIYLQLVCFYLFNLITSYLWLFFSTILFALIMSSPNRQRTSPCPSETNARSSLVDSEPLLPGLFRDKQGLVRSYVPRPKNLLCDQVTADGKFLNEVIQQRVITSYSCVAHAFHTHVLLICPQDTNPCYRCGRHPYTYDNVNR